MSTTNPPARGEPTRTRRCGRRATSPASPRACARAASRSSARSGSRRGQSVLDLGCGDGTTAIPAARLGADVLGVDIAANLVEAGNERARSLGLANCRFQEGDASELAGIDDASFDLVVSIFGAMFAPKPNDVAKEMVRVTRPGGRIVMGNWIPGDPTLVAQILQDQLRLLASAAGGLREPDDVGRRGERDRALHRRRRGREGRISFERDTYTFNFPGTPSELPRRVQDVLRARR